MASFRIRRNAPARSPRRAPSFPEGRFLAMPKRKAGLSPKQEKFLREYLIDQNAYQAALRAGYSPATARAQHTLLRNPVVARKIEELRQAGLRKIELKLERVLEEA